MSKICACCHEPLDSDGDCINECTADPRYGVAEGYAMDEEEYFFTYKECEECGEKFTHEEICNNTKKELGNITFTCPKCEWDIYLSKMPITEE